LHGCWYIACKIYFADIVNIGVACTVKIAFKLNIADIVAGMVDDMINIAGTVCLTA
jgi:hypothetical protein